MMYRLSFFVPVRFKTVYGCADGAEFQVRRASWWQWRNRIWAHKSWAVLSGLP